MNSFDAFPSPLLVPSFSSKGTLVKRDKFNNVVSDNNSLILALDARLQRSYLVSAYDVYYGLMPNDPEQYPSAEYIFIDSGGYETSHDYDIFETYNIATNPYEWREEMMLDVYHRFSNSEKLGSSGLIFTTFDIRGEYKIQLNSALELMQCLPNSTIDFLIRIIDSPQNAIDFIKENKNEFCKFRIIGFTEKELGDNFKQRLINVTKIRQALDGLNWDGYIHIFGGLEPNVSALFYAAGASIVDGLSWQKGRYKNGTTLMSSDQYIITRSDAENRFWMMVENLAVIDTVSGRLADLSESFSEQGSCLLSRIESVLHYSDNLSLKDALNNVYGGKF